MYQQSYPALYPAAYPDTDTDSRPATHLDPAPSAEPLLFAEEGPAPEADSTKPIPAYPSEGRLASALSDHFSRGFDANFVEDVQDESPAWLRDGLSAGRNAGSNADLTSTFTDDYADEFGEEGSPFSGGFDRRLAQQFTGDVGMDGFDEDAPSLNARHLSLRSLQWIRRNMTSLRIIVSLQRVTPPEPLDDRPRKFSGD